MDEMEPEDEPEPEKAPASEGSTVELTEEPVDFDEPPEEEELLSASESVSEVVVFIPLPGVIHVRVLQHRRQWQKRGCFRACR